MDGWSLSGRLTTEKHPQTTWWQLAWRTLRGAKLN